MEGDAVGNTTIVFEKLDGTQAESGRIALVKPFLHGESSGSVYQLTPPYGIQAPLAVQTRVPVFMCPSDTQQSVCSNAYAIPGDLAPTNYAFCLGSGTSKNRTNWLGSPWDADGAFYAQSKVRMTGFGDGTSNTVAIRDFIFMTYSSFLAIFEGFTF